MYICPEIPAHHSFCCSLSLPTTMDEFVEQFSSLMTPSGMAEAKAESVRSFKRDMTTQSENIRLIPPDPKKSNMFPPLDGIESLGPTDFQSTFQKILKTSMSPRYPPPSILQCANVQATKYTACEKPGTMACSICKLVSYCSKVIKRRLRCGCHFIILLGMPNRPLEAP